MGLCWNPTLDKFTIANSKKSVALTQDASEPKVAVVVASIFHPLQLNSPSSILHKIFLQELLLQRFSLDDTLPTELLEKWHQLYKQLDSVGQFEIDRLVLLKGAVDVQVRKFADASDRHTDHVLPEVG